MNISRVFINRPVATSLLTLAIALVGCLAFVNLPISAYPQIELPTIVVQAVLPGASAQTMAATVATPLERALGRIAGVSQMSSTSVVGSSQITLQFDLDRDVYGAGRDVQAAINAASTLLPTGMPSRPSYQPANPSDAPIMILSLTALDSTPDHGQLHDVATRILAKKIMQISGMGLVQVGGGNISAVRIELNPYALSKYGIDLETIRHVIKDSNLNRPKGILEHGRERWQIQANDQAKKADDYLPLIICYRNNAAITLADIGIVTDSVEDFRNIGIKDGQSSVLLMLKKQSSANTIAIVNTVNDLLPELQAALSNNMALSVVLDQSVAIRASIHELEFSLGLAVFLVFWVTLLFLTDFRATLVPMISVSVALLAACLIMYFCHFSLNNLTLMALIVATGFVVDDAIVVLENTKRYIGAGVKPYQAAALASQEVSFTLLAMSLSLIAVFLPVLFMSGTAGRVFREFAVTLSTAVLVSLLISLTTTPMLCARWLCAESIVLGRLAGIISASFAKVLRVYAYLLHWALNHGLVVLSLLGLIFLLNIYLYNDVKKGYFPVQDDGRLNGVIIADQSISFGAMKKKLTQFSDILQKDPAVNHVVGYAGGGGAGNVASLFVLLKSHQQREPIDEVVKRLRRLVERVSGASLLLFVMQDLQLGGQSSGSLYNFTLQSDDVSLLWQWTPKVLTALKNRPELSDVTSNLQDKGQQIGLVIDREKASRYGITQAMIETTFYNAFGQRQISVIYNDSNQYHVVIELAPEYWQSSEALKQVFISVPDAATTRGAVVSKQIPLSSFAYFAPNNTPLNVTHQGQFASVSFSFGLQPDISFVKATELIKQAIQEIGTPETITSRFLGSIKTAQDFLTNQPWLFLATVLAIYSVLGILYESYIHPLTILSTLPSAGVGALFTLTLFDIELNMTSIVGMLLLVGIVQKNAIIMVDFAITTQRVKAVHAKSAIYQAGLQRFRPIVMTSLVALFTALPLLFATGYGAELRQPLGFAIVGGLLFSQVITLFTTPVVYVYLDRYHKRLKL